MEGKYKGRNDHWFQAKEGDTLSGDLDDATEDNSGDKVNVVRNTLMKFLCKSGKSETTDFYWILGLFKKYYNKRFHYLDGTFVSDDNEAGIKNPRVLSRMMEKRGSIIKEVKLEKGGMWGPNHVYEIKALNDVLGVECDLDEY